MWITNLFLKAKHWQLFMVTFALPAISQLIFLVFVIRAAVSGDDTPPPAFVMFLPVIGLSFFAIVFGWMWSVVMGLQRRLPESLRINTTRFNVFFFFPLIYLLAIWAYFAIAVTRAAEGDPPSATSFIGFSLLILMVHLFCIFCVFHTIFYVAKTIKTLEVQTELDFFEFAGSFFLVWFYFIGLWILQPKINKLAEIAPPIQLTPHQQPSQG